MKKSAFLSYFHREVQSYNKSSKSTKMLQYLRFEEFYAIQRASFEFWVVGSTSRLSADFRAQGATEKTKKEANLLFLSSKLTI